MTFSGKNILVAGGSSGIGLSLVNLLRSQEAKVYVISRNVSSEWPGGIIHIPADITSNLDHVSALLPGKLDGLVYSVGSINLKPFGRLTEADFLADYQVNVLGAVRVVQLALPFLKSSGNASVVLLSSVAARTGMPYHASISASKAAVEGLALSLAAELAGLKIRVNVVAPSLTDTPLAHTLLGTPERREASAKRHPLGKYGQPEDISRAIMFLLSADSNWMTGQVIGIDGGLGNLKVN